MATINIKTLDGLLEIFGGYQSIIDALGYVPANKDGVLSNEYFGDLDGDTFYITDKSGNIIFKADKDGIATTKVTANTIDSQSIESESASIDQLSAGLVNASAGVIDNLHVESLTVDNIEGDINANNIQSETISSSLVSTNIVEADEFKTSGDSFMITDESGNIIAKIDSNGIETTHIKANNITGDLEGTIHGDLIGNVIGNVTGVVTGNLIGNVTGDLVGDKVEVNLVSASTISVDEIKASGDNFIMSDEDGNMILKVDGSGLETTNVKAFKIDTDEININEKITTPEIESDSILTGTLSTGIATIAGSTTTGTLTVNDSASIKNLSSESADITSINSGNITSGSIETDNLVNTGDSYHIVDSANNIITTIDENGITTTKVTAEFHGNLKGKADDASLADYAVSAGNASSADRVENKLTIISGPTSNPSSIEFDGSSNQSVTITPSTLGLAQAMLYIGTSTTVVTDGGSQKPTIGGSQKTPTSGNVVIYDNNEFIWNGSTWEKLGDEMNHKVLQTPVSDPTASGKAKEFIDYIEQDANGNIIVTKKTVDTSNITSDLITVDTIVANTGNIDTIDSTNINSDLVISNSVETDNLINGGSNLYFTDVDGNILATFNSTGLGVTNVDAANKVSANILEGNLDWNYLINIPDLGGKTGTAITAGKHTHNVTSSGTVTSTFSGNQFTTSNVNDHVHSVSASGNTGNAKSSGTVTSTFSGNQFTTSSSDDHIHSVNVKGTLSGNLTGTEHTHTFNANPHTHTFEISVGGGETTVNGDVTSTFEDNTGHTHVISGTSAENGAHSHSVSGSTGDSSNHKHSFTPSGTIGTSGGFTPSGEVSLSGSESNGILTISAVFTGNSVAAHDHSFTGTSGNTGNAGAHSHSISISTTEAGDHSHTIAFDSANAKSSGTVSSNFSGSISIDLGASSGTTSAATVTGDITKTKAGGTVSTAIDITTNTAGAGAHSHTGTPTGDVTSTFSDTTGHTHSFSYSGNSGAAGAHSHTGTPTGDVTSTFTGKSSTTTENGDHSHVVEVD